MFAIKEYDPTKPAYVFSPEEPELQIYVGGVFLRFTNGRLIIVPSPGAEQVIKHLSESKRDFIYTQDVKDPGVFVQLQQRVLAMCARKAHALDAMKVLDEMTFLVAAMTSREHSQLQRMGTEQVASILAAALPSAAAAFATPVDYAAEVRASQDEAMIEASLADQPDIAAELAEEAKPVIAPDSPYAAIMSQPEPEPLVPEEVEPPARSPF